MDIKFMERALTLARQSAEADEIPVGAVVVKDGVIVGESENRKERDNSATSHAEMLALKQATENVGNWWLEDCDVYVNLEPCPMCAMAMVLSRVRNLYFGAYDDKTGATGSKINIFEEGLFNHTVNVQGGILESESAEMIKTYFKGMRAKRKTEKSK